MFGAAGGFVRRGLIAGLIARLALAFLVGLRSALVGRGVCAGAANAGLVGLLAAAFLPLARAVAGRVALGGRFVAADAGRLGLLALFLAGACPALPGFS